MEILSMLFLLLGGGIFILRKMKKSSKILSKSFLIGGLVLILVGIILGTFSLVSGIKEGWNSYQESPRRVNHN